MVTNLIDLCWFIIRRQKKSSIWLVQQHWKYIYDSLHQLSFFYFKNGLKKKYCAFYYCVRKLTVFPEAVCCLKGNPLTRQRVWYHRYIAYTAATIDNHFPPHHLPLLVAALTSLQASWRSTQFPSIILTSTSPITSTIDSRPRGCEPYLYPTTAHGRERRMGPNNGTLVH